MICCSKNKSIYLPMFTVVLI